LTQVGSSDLKNLIKRLEISSYQGSHVIVAWEVAHKGIEQVQNGK
jgi:hypothetical protein